MRGWGKPYNLVHDATRRWWTNLVLNDSTQWKKSANCDRLRGNIEGFMTGGDDGEPRFICARPPNFPNDTLMAAAMFALVNTDSLWLVAFDKSVTDTVSANGFRGMAAPAVEHRGSPMAFTEARCPNPNVTSGL